MNGANRGVCHLRTQYMNRYAMGEIDVVNCSVECINAGRRAFAAESKAEQSEDGWLVKGAEAFELDHHNAPL